MQATKKLIWYKNTIMMVGKAYKHSHFTAGTDEMYPKANAVMEVSVVRVIERPISSTVSAIRSTGSFEVSVLSYAPMIINASSSPIPKMTNGIN